jgi:hypothetical protein
MNVMHGADSAMYPEAAYWLGKVQQFQGKYDPALMSYQAFLEIPDADSALVADAKHAIVSCEWAKEHINEVDDSITVERMGDVVNTLFSEFGAVQRDSTMYFTRLAYERHKMDTKDKPIFPALLYSQVLVSEQDSSAHPLDSTFNEQGAMHTAHTAFSLDGSRVYYTLCEYLNKSDVRCDLYYRDVLEGGGWGEAQQLPVPLNAEGFTTTQPSIGYDKSTGKQILYFVSDRPGGKGNLDIWYSVINDPNNVTQPKPLTAVNTPWDEMTPFFHQESETLFFSSEGYPGFGGLDIYQSRFEGGTWSTPENLGISINSSYADAYYVLSADEETALFSSNRLGSVYFESSREACCFDVYKVFLIPPPKPVDVIVEARTFDARKREPLPGTTVEITDMDGESYGRKVDEYTHIQHFTVPLNNSYTVTGTRKGYRTASATVAEDMLTGDTVIVDLFLELGNLEDFLPLAIYFDNDQPEPRSNTETTTLRYLETYEPYYESKDKFKRRYTRGVDKSEVEGLELEIETFFEDSLRRSKGEFESFLNILHQYLDEGLWFKIFLKGYTSPLASNTYNYQLGQRRISTIQNEFAAFRGGVLKKYFESGDLEVVEKSFGEETAPPTVSDDPRDTRRSIFSPEASVERRVEIIEIEKE